jgi:predicted ribosome quality control (RQC) complex YloA/Tae2 family protein
MNSEFEEFEQELDELEQELDDFENELDEFEDEMNAFEEDVDALERELDIIEFTDVNTRTAILSKNDMFALLCLKTATQGGAICRVDPREANPAVQLYDDPDKALDWFTKSLRTSQKNGWRVIYDGLPLAG